MLVSSEEIINWNNNSKYESNQMDSHLMKNTNFVESVLHFYTCNQSENQKNDLLQEVCTLYIHLFTGVNDWNKIYQINKLFDYFSELTNKMPKSFNLDSNYYFLQKS